MSSSAEPEYVYSLCVCVCVQDQAKAIDRFDERVKNLQKRSLQVLPLSYRRETPQKLLPVEALCEFDTEDVRSLMLIANTHNARVTLFLLLLL